MEERHEKARATQHNKHVIVMSTRERDPLTSLIMFYNLLFIIFILYIETGANFVGQWLSCVTSLDLGTRAGVAAGDTRMSRSPLLSFRICHFPNALYVERTHMLPIPPLEAKRRAHQTHHVPFMLHEAVLHAAWLVARNKVIL